MKTNEIYPETANREIISTRLFDASPILMYKAWTTPEYLAQWWGPEGFTNTFHKFELKPGGAWEFTMHGPNGVDYFNQSAFVRMDYAKQIVIKHISKPEFELTATFESLTGDKTKLTFRMLFATAELCDKLKSLIVPSNEQNFDRLEALLSKLSTIPELVIKRVINAPRALVFKAFTEGKHLAKWWGPKGFDIEVAQMDFQPGGIFHYRMQSLENVMWGKFFYREIVSPERIVFVNSFSDKDGNITKAPFGIEFPLHILNIITLEEAGDNTLLELRGSPLNATNEEQQVFESIFESMDEGYNGTFDQLEDYLKRSVS